MEKEGRFQTNSIQELINAVKMTNVFDHLKIIISHKPQRTIDDDYLFVSTSGFELVKIMDLDYECNRVKISLKSQITGNTKEFVRDVDDDSFHFMLINAEDIKELIKITAKNPNNREELLDFQF